MNGGSRSRHEPCVPMVVSVTPVLRLSFLNVPIIVWVFQSYPVMLSIGPVSILGVQPVCRDWIIERKGDSHDTSDVQLSFTVETDTLTS